MQEYLWVYVCMRRFAILMAQFFAVVQNCTATAMATATAPPLQATVVSTVCVQHVALCATN